MTKKKDTTKLLIIVIAILGLLLIVAVGSIAYILGKSTSNGSVSQTPQELEITFISDSRCNDCQEEALKAQLGQQPLLSQWTIIEKEFSDKGVEKYLKENNISLLPAVILNHNNVGADIQGFLVPLPSGEYSLNIWAPFDPFVERSDRGFTQISPEQIKQITWSANTKGDADANIVWIEYSDLDCPACKAFYNSGVSDKLLTEYTGTIKKLFQHFPLDSIHPVARAKAEHIECAAELSGNPALVYDLIDTNFSSGLALFDFKDLIAENNIAEDAFSACTDSADIKDLVQNHMQQWIDIFGVNATPTSVLLNTTTGEYELVRWAGPISQFEAAIEWLK